MMARAARLLVVDDHEIVRFGVVKLLAKDPNFVVCGEASNGVEAIKKVEELAPDAVILDLSMPGMSGFEVAEELHHIAPRSRIIFFSMHEIPTIARLAGADAFVSKTDALRDLVPTLSRVLSGAQ